MSSAAFFDALNGFGGEMLCCGFIKLFRESV
jgi:hypothetical protein